ncbi:MAG TPA: hypothetical protein VJT31_06655 [Rugosimonospora sp.]|nr:hypothetical protein [Rugosimonospora sp.]
MIEVVLFTDETDSAEPPLPAVPDRAASFVDVEDGDPLGPGEEGVLDIAGI